MYTHDFEIDIDGIQISGEINFGDGEEAKFRTIGGEEMTVAQHGRVQMLFETLVRACKTCGEIQTFEINKKV